MMLFWYLDIENIEHLDKIPLWSNVFIVAFGYTQTSQEHVAMLYLTTYVFQYFNIYF